MSTSIDLAPVLYTFDDYYRGEYGLFCLTNTGQFYFKDKAGNPHILDWYKDDRSGKPWIPAKRRTFVSLVKQSARDGDFK